jgi:hypothetical protein
MTQVIIRINAYADWCKNTDILQPAAVPPAAAAALPYRLLTFENASGYFHGDAGGGKLPNWKANRRRVRMIIESVGGLGD